MARSDRKTFRGDFRRFFVKGLAVLLPTVLTMWILVKAYEFVDVAIAQPINRGIRLVMNQATPHVGFLEAEFEPSPQVVDRGSQHRLRQPQALVQGGGPPRAEGGVHPGLGCTVVHGPRADRGDHRGVRGRSAARGIPRRDLQQAGVAAPPCIGRCTYVKQVHDFFSDEKPINFNRVVLVQHHEGRLVDRTGHRTPMVHQQEMAPGQARSIFIPSLHPLHRLHHQRPAERSWNSP